MRVFKFGGASVKDAAGVQNVLRVLQTVGHTEILIVISAMGKTTNALEDVVTSYRNGDTSEVEHKIQTIQKNHDQIISDLFEEDKDDILQKTFALFEELRTILNRNKSPKYDYIYDQVVSFGELISTTIVNAYLSQQGLNSQWLDARQCIKTDNTYRDAGVDWKLTEACIQQHVREGQLYITQGFIGSDPNNFTTTLGREGSDYSAGIFAYCLNAESVSIWKDVPGVLNGDPRVFDNTELLHHISYEEAIELAFYGASVIHPKTLQPLQRKEIPLYVKSFINPKNDGTAVRKGQALDPYIPCYIVKKNQVLLSLSTRDFSFVVEENISELFNHFHRYQMKVDLIQNSAISFSVCVDNKFNHLDTLLEQLEEKFIVSCTKNVSLYTIRHYTPEAVANFEQHKSIQLKQLTTDTYQVVVKE